MSDLPSTTRGLVFKGPGDAIGEGDSALFLTGEMGLELEGMFEKLKEEVQWNVMRHHGMLRLRGIY